MKVAIPNVEIRGYEERESKKEGQGNYLIVRFEDETGKAEEAIDREVERGQYYRRGTVGTLFCNLKKGKDWASLTILEFKAGVRLVEEKVLEKA